jgi:hypothetical protein
MQLDFWDVAEGWVFYGLDRWWGGLEWVDGGKGFGFGWRFGVNLRLGGGGGQFILVALSGLSSGLEHGGHQMLGLNR